MDNCIAASPQDRIAASPVEGRDEMNLAEFPMALLAHRAPPGQKTMHFHKTIRGPDSRPLEQHWIITATDEFGLPVAGDEELYLALLDLSRRQGFPEVVRFSRYELMQRMHWKPTGGNYRRILEGLRRLSGVAFYARNAFWDNASKRYVKEAKFSVIADYAVNDSNPSQQSLPLSWIRWSPTLAESFRAGHIKSLDLARYYRLESTLARRLYRHLDRKLGRKDRFAIDLFMLAHEHLGMTRSWRYASELRRRLDPALEELKRDGYLANWTYRESASRDSIVVEFERARIATIANGSGTTKQPAAEQDTDPAGWFVEQLTGSRRSTPADARVARKFIAEHGIDAFREFAEFATSWREENWPEMRTLSGAMGACFDAFLVDRAERGKLSRARAEERRVAAWLDAVESAVEPYRRIHGDAVRRFEEDLESNAEYRRLLAMAETYRGQESMRAYSLEKIRSLRLRSFHERFPDCGVPPLERWTPLQVA